MHFRASTVQCWLIFALYIYIYIFILINFLYSTVIDIKDDPHVY